MSAALPLLQLLFGFRERVARRSYLSAGVALFVLKYAVDLALSAIFAEHALDPLAYLNPLLSARLSALGAHPDWLPPLLLAWALPFIWIGVSMSARRALNAGKTPWLSLLFLLPVVNYFLIVGLCVLPEAPRLSQRGAGQSVGAERMPADLALGDLRLAVLSVSAASLFGVLATALSVYGIQQYGSLLFLGAPFLMGVISGVLLNRRGLRSLRATLGMAALSVTLSGGVLLLLALEGVLCLLMAAVLAYPLAILGALVGRAFAGGSQPLQPTLSMLAAWPLLALLPVEDAERFPVRATLSALEIDAPPERVWPHVVGFSTLPPPHEWLLQAGVACPLRARIVGQGVGAVRYCEFSTGPFVEPITAWEPPYRLAFDVASQPPSMHEWSPYEVVNAPHLHGGVQSVRGEFRLTRLPGDRTRLEGTTWYRLKMAPNGYWALFGDYAIHVIHERVLNHIRALSLRAPSDTPVP